MTLNEALGLKERAYERLPTLGSEAIEWLEHNLVGLGVGFRAADDWYAQVYLSIAVPGWLGEMMQALSLFPVVTGEFHALGGHRQNMAGSLHIGSNVSLGGINEVGTLCAFATRSGQRLLLSCRHVLNGNPGDLVFRKDPVAERIGLLDRVAPFPVDPKEPHLGDWSQARLDSAVSINTSLPRGLGTLASEVPLVNSDIDLEKASIVAPFGGRVHAINADFKVTFDSGGGVVRTFQGQMLVESLSNAQLAVKGESGTLLVDHSSPRRAVGMIFAANVPAPQGEAQTRLTGVFPLARLFNDAAHELQILA